MSRSEVWEEVHLIPLRMKFQREADGSVVMQLPGYQLPVVTVTGRDKGEAIALMDEHMHAASGVQEPDLSEQGRNRSAVLGNTMQALTECGVPFVQALDATLKAFDHPPADGVKGQGNG